MLFAVSVALGAGLTWYPVPGRYHSLQIYLLTMAVIMFVTGLVTFVHFLRTNPVRDLEEDENAG